MRVLACSAVSALVAIGDVTGTSLAGTFVVDTFDVAFGETISNQLQSVAQQDQGIFTGLPGATDYRWAQLALSNGGSYTRSLSNPSAGLANVTVSGGGSFTQANYILGYGLTGDSFDLSGFDQLSIEGAGHFGAGGSFLSAGKAEIILGITDSNATTTLTQSLVGGTTATPNSIGDITFDLTGLTNSSVNLQDVNSFTITFKLGGIVNFTYDIDQITMSGSSPVVPGPGALAVACGISAMGRGRRRSNS
jgi:hypothetical protein